MHFQDESKQAKRKFHTFNFELRLNILHPYLNIAQHRRLSTSPNTLTLMLMIFAARAFQYRTTPKQREQHVTHARDMDKVSGIADTYNIILRFYVYMYNYVYFNVKLFKSDDTGVMQWYFVRTNRLYRFFPHSTWLWDFSASLL